LASSSSTTTAKIKTHKLWQVQRRKGAGMASARGRRSADSRSAGVVGGGILGAFHLQGPRPEPPADFNPIAPAGGGKAAVGASRKADQADAIRARLTEPGGTDEVVEVPEEAARKPIPPPAVEEAQVCYRRSGRFVDGIGPTTRLRPAQPIKTFARLSEQIRRTRSGWSSCQNAGVADRRQPAGTWPRQAK
jgi:hypothetical protein